MKIIKGTSFQKQKAWDSELIHNFNGTTVKLHWTDQAYKWHTNDGEEVFVVLSGIVEMYYKEQGLEQMVLLEPGDIFFADAQTEHYAKPIKEANILVIEKEDSI